MRSRVAVDYPPEHYRIIRLVAYRGEFMHILRVYYNNDIKSNSSIKLDAKASHHLVRVLRIKMGDALILFNGEGNEYTATLTAIENKHAIVNVMSEQPGQTESPLQLELGQGISRGERMDYTIQKSVELGVSKIVPLFTERCGVTLTDKRLENRLRHWRNVIISACEQSGRCIIPELATAQPLNTWLTQKRNGLKLVCDPNAEKGLSDLPKTEKQVTVLIGPEGGLTDEEMQQEKNADFIGFSLGPRILRTETAAVAAVSLLQSHFGDMAVYSTPLTQKIDERE